MAMRETSGIRENGNEVVCRKR